MYQILSIFEYVELNDGQSIANEPEPHRPGQEMRRKMLCKSALNHNYYLQQTFDIPEFQWTRYINKIYITESISSAF